jgi:excisionase family DNA binding protein
MNYTAHSDPVATDPRERLVRKPLGEHLLTTEELAVFLGLSSQVLKINRMTGNGIPFIRIGRSIRYRLCDVESYLAANTVKCESAAGVSPVSAADFR